MQLTKIIKTNRANFGEYREEIVEVDQS